MIKYIKTIIIIFFLSSLSFYGQGLDRTELTKTTIEALKNSRLDKILELALDENDFNYLTKNEKKSYDATKINYEINQERKNLEYRYEKLKRISDPENPEWENATINRIIYVTEKVNGNKFSSILVELIYNQKKYYLEIDTVLTKNGWKIHDDIMIVVRDIDKRIKNKNRKMI